MEQQRLEEEMKNLDVARRQQREAEYKRAQEQMEAAMYPNLQYPDIPGMGRYAGGGIVSMLPARRMQEGGSTDEEQRQPPPGYRPGIDPEFLYSFSGAPQAGRFGGTIVGTGQGAVEQFVMPGLTGVFGNLNPGGDPFIPGITTAYGTNLMADPLVGSGTTRAEIVDEITTGSFGSTGDRGMRTGIEGDRFGNPINAEMAYRVGAPEEAVRRLVEQEDARRRAGQQGYAPADRVVPPPTPEQVADFQDRQAAVQAGGDMERFLAPEVKAQRDAADQSRANLGAFLRGEITAEDMKPAVTEPVQPAPASIQSVTEQISQGGIGNIPVEPGLASSANALAAPPAPQVPQLTETQIQAIQNAIGMRTGSGRGGISPMIARYQEGGMVEGSDPLVEMTVRAIRGELPEGADQVIESFIQAYGNDAFLQLREEVLQEVVPGAQTQGMIRGQGGGMDDEVMGMIGSSQPVAVSPGEYIVPADAVSGLGDGSSDAGAARLDELVESVRKARTGTAKQPAPIKESMGGKV